MNCLVNIPYTSIVPAASLAEVLGEEKKEMDVVIFISVCHSLRYSLLSFYFIFLVTQGKNLWVNNIYCTAIWYIGILPLNQHIHIVLVRHSR